MAATLSVKDCFTPDALRRVAVRCGENGATCLGHRNATQRSATHPERTKLIGYYDDIHALFTTDK